MNAVADQESPEQIAHDVAAVGRIAAVSSILDVICNNTGMRFSAVARVTDRSWTACAVKDDLALGLMPGGQLELQTTLCMESRLAREPIVIDHVSTDPLYASHHTPRLYHLQSYISVPIVLPDGEYFGNLCALDSVPHTVSTSSTVSMFKAFAELIALHLHNERLRENELRRSAARLAQEQQTSELREQFIAVLGHDLRGPLSAISNHAELLIRRPQEPFACKSGQYILTAVNRMAGLVDDVMDFARGRMGAGIALSIVPQSAIGQAVEDVIMELRVSHPDHVLQTEIAAAIPPVPCDLPRVQQVVSNLVGNALLYGTRAAPVRVTVSNTDSCLEIAVWNGGAAIDAEAQARMFDPYWRASDQEVSGGLGLGLFICSQIVKAHRGSIDLTSTEEAGTTFLVRLPLHA
jgi:signal transduction histidine kinase